MRISYKDDFAYVAQESKIKFDNSYNIFILKLCFAHESKTKFGNSYNSSIYHWD